MPRHLSCGSLHDVGKVAIPDSILLKPGRLNKQEIAVIRTHAEIGSRILADSPCELIQIGATIAAAHHERWDGSGYPRGLKESEIPIAARVVTVADVFDALTTRRPYKEAMPLETARQYLEDKKGQEFDPACVDAFLSRWDEVAAIARPKSAPAAPQAEITAPPLAAVEQPADHRDGKLAAPV